MTAAANGNPTSDGMLRTLLEDAGMELAADAANGPDGVGEPVRPDVVLRASTCPHGRHPDHGLHPQPLPEVQVVMCSSAEARTVSMLATPMRHQAGGPARRHLSWKGFQ
jgi:hypothetical protein